MKTILVGNNYYIRTMKKYILPFMSIAMLMAMASCSSSDDAVEEIKEESKLVPMTFTATQEGNAGTRSALDAGTQVLWNTGDKISVFDGYNDTDHNRSFTLEGDGGETSGSFTGTASSEATTFTAVYPYTEGATLESEGSVSGITLPAEQTATANSFDPNAALMMAVSTTDKKYNLDFKNAVSLVKVTPQFNCTKIELEAADGSGDILAGKGTLNWNGGNPNINITEETSKTITLNGSIAKGNSYCIVVPTGTINRMWKISFTAKDDEKKYTRYCSKLLTIERNKIINLGNFATDSPFWADEHRGNKVTYEQEVDLGLTITADSKQYRVIFANANLTATGLAASATDYGDYFAWGAREPWYSSATRTWKDGKSDGYIQANAPLYEGSSYTKYTNQYDVLEAADDAARQILGGDWKIPTTEIWKALYDANKDKVYWGPNNGDMTLETISGIQGMKIAKKEDSNTYIFLPAAGRFHVTSSEIVGAHGYYWSGTAEEIMSYGDAYSYSLYFESVTLRAQNADNRYYGLSVRPVRLVEVLESQQ